MNATQKVQARADDKAGRAVPDRAALDKAMADQGLTALWKVYDKLVTKEPSDAVPSHIWRWQDLAPVVGMAAASVTGHDADHRVLVLGNPNLKGRVASVTNIVGAIQCVNPGERTSPHRHTPAAVRVVLEGAGESSVGAVTHRWQKHDVFTLPEWAWVSHKASGAPARLLLVTDREVRRRLGLLREERG